MIIMKIINPYFPSEVGENCINYAILFELEYLRTYSMK